MVHKHQNHICFYIHRLDKALHKCCLLLFEDPGANCRITRGPDTQLFGGAQPPPPPGQKPHPDLPPPLSLPETPPPPQLQAPKGASGQRQVGGGSWHPNLRSPPPPQFLPRKGGELRHNHGTWCVKLGPRGTGG